MIVLILTIVLNMTIAFLFPYELKECVESASVPLDNSRFDHVTYPRGQWVKADRAVDCVLVAGSAVPPPVCIYSAALKLILSYGLDISLCAFHFNILLIFSSFPRTSIQCWSVRLFLLPFFSKCFSFVLCR